MTHFSQAIQDLAALEAALEDNPETPLSQFENLVDNAKGAIDRRAMLLNAMDSRLEHLKAIEDNLKAHRKRLESAKAWFVSQTVAFMKEHPEWTWEGDIHKLKIVKNGGKQAVAWRPFCEPQRLDRVVPEAIAPSISREWISVQTVHVLKGGYEDAIRSGLEEGPIDVLPRGERLVVR